MRALSNKKSVLAIVAGFATTALTLGSVLPANAAPDTTLNIGGILPTTGNLAYLGPPEIAGVNAAVADINAAGGVLGNKVVAKFWDSGAAIQPEIAQAAANKAIAAKTNVVIGAASSSVSLSIVKKLAAAGIVQISPANTSPDLTTVADNGFYFRTAPSDLLQGKIQGQLITGDGNSRVAAIYQSSSYGSGLFKAFSSSLKANRGTLVASEAYPEAETNYATYVAKVVAQKPQAIIIIGYEETKKILAELQKAQFDGSKIYLVDGNLASMADESFKAWLKGAKGTTPGPKVSAAQKAKYAKAYAAANNGADLGTETAYANESYDATVLAALAAIAAKDASGAAIKKQLQAVSTKGTVCTSFKSCAAMLKAGKDIDYDGVSGPVEFDKNGDPQGATMGIYQYNAEGAYAWLKGVSAPKAK
jgi:branched-chain amino acid transport system substrate-binding protein